MLLYNVRLAWKSLLRNPMLSLLTLGAIGLGITVATSFTTIYYLLAADPLPHKSDDIFYVRLDSWDPERPFDDDYPERPPNQVTCRDALALLDSDIPTHHAAMFHAGLFAHPQDAGERPFEVDVRLTTRGFFSIFDVPFAYGGPWDARADTGPEPLVVIDHATNQRLFGGGDSVGREIRIAQHHFTVAGVLTPWRPITKFYDVHNDDRGAPEAVYMPFRHVVDMRIPTSGNTSSWSGYESFDEFLQSEAVWVQMWAQLDGTEQRARYQTFLDAYSDEQRALGRFGRPNNNWVQPMLEFHDEMGVVPPQSKGMMIIALLFLTVCSINLIGLLLGKFLARSSEVGVRRALGASRGAIFLQHIVECQLLGVLGGALGVAFSVVALRGISRMFSDQLMFQLDLNMVTVAIAMALVSGLVAGVYPAWRICSIPPAIHLKMT